MSKEARNPRAISDFATEFLADDTVALIIKQQLAPDDLENPVIFPPTYLAAKAKADVSSADEKKNQKEQQKSIYNLDELWDGRNIVEIDSPQSDGNRVESLFKRAAYQSLVPQIEIAVGTEKRSILDAGHRAADALVRFSSLAYEFHEAFERTQLSPPDHSMLATIAPTSILHGAYDSRSTQSKLQRIIKASIRAENVKPLRKSATFVPAVDYVAVGAIKEGLDNDVLSSEGFKHAPASETLGGVRLSDPNLLVRTIKINLAAIRALNAIPYPIPQPRPLPQDATQEQRDTHERAQAKYEQLKSKATEEQATRTKLLRQYILALALTEAQITPDLNLREGCNLRLVGNDEWLLVRHRHQDQPVSVQDVPTFAKKAMEDFFTAMGIDPYDKNHLSVTFETGVAEEFLGLTDSKGKPSKAERDKARAIGPINKDTMAKYWAERRKRDKSGDPKDKLRALIEKIKPTRGGKLNAEAEKLRKHMSDNPADTDELKGVYGRITEILDGSSSAEDKIAALKAVLPATAAAANEQPTDARSDDAQ